MKRITILSDRDCPNVDAARERVTLALQRVGMPARWDEVDRASAQTPAELRAFASPTVLVDGQDVAAGVAGHSACRLYRDAEGKLDVAPAVAAIVAALLSSDESA